MWPGSGSQRNPFLSCFWPRLSKSQKSNSRSDGKTVFILLSTPFCFPWSLQDGQFYISLFVHECSSFTPSSLNCALDLNFPGCEQHWAPFHTLLVCLLWNVHLRCLHRLGGGTTCWTLGIKRLSLLSFLRDWDRSTGPVQYNFGCGFRGIEWRWESGSLCAAQTGLQLSVCLSIPSAGMTGMPADPAPCRFMLACLFFCWIVGVLCSLFPSRVEAELW